jgi:hypothetical protein
MKKKWSWRVLVAVVVLMGFVLLAACDTPAPPPAEEAQSEEVAPAEPEVEEKAEEVEPPPEPTATEPPPPTATPEPTPVPPTPTLTAEPTLEPLPPEPVDIEFQTEDMMTLTGRYYPAAVNPAPIVVLHHWAPGDMEDWNEIAFWLQNRGLSGTSPNLGQDTWLEPSWFPPMPEGLSFAVFTFNYRGCAGGCSSFNPNGWILDAVAAMETAMNLEGVDPNLLSAIGASTGADGSVDSCEFHNNVHENSCLGALSYSPGNYFQIPYPQEVELLDQEAPPKPVFCFYSDGDFESAPTCKSATGDHFQLFEWPGSKHGMLLLEPEMDPDPLGITLDFLKMVYGLE